jgi:hypothetical protein
MEQLHAAAAPATGEVMGGLVTPPSTVPVALVGLPVRLPTSVSTPLSFTN